MGDGIESQHPSFVCRVLHRTKPLTMGFVANVRFLLLLWGKSSRAEISEFPDLKRSSTLPVPFPSLVKDHLVKSFPRLDFHLIQTLAVVWLIHCPDHPCPTGLPLTLPSSTPVHPPGQSNSLGSFVRQAAFHSKRGCIVNYQTVLIRVAWSSGS